MAITIHNAEADGLAVSLIERSADYVIVVNQIGGAFAFIDPRGRSRDHAVRCYMRTIENLTPEAVYLRAMLDARARGDVPPDAA